MRARQRHFNPTAAGAVAAYDARFITGLSDGSNMAQWTSRTGTNNATQPTVANQPNYETNEINGNPVVNFTAANADQFVVNISVPASLTVVKVHRRLSSGIQNVDFGEFVSSPRYGMWWFNDNGVYTSSNGSQNTHGSAVTTTGSFVESWQKNSNISSQVFRNGTSVGTPQTPGISNGAFNRIGKVSNNAGVHGNQNGAIGCLILLNQSNTPVRKRLERAAAYSFKIACS
jgi:hypothetical protein